MSVFDSFAKRVIMGRRPKRLIHHAKHFTLLGFFKTLPLQAVKCNLPHL
jgi:hypothetical protein